MRFRRTLLLLAVLIVVVVVKYWPRINPHRHAGATAAGAITDLSVTHPLNQPGGGAVSPAAYEIYSALYQTATGEPLVFGQNSVTDIPQVNGSCLKPSTPQERDMADAFQAANQQSHEWEQKFTIPGGYQMLSRAEASEVQACMDTHGRDAARCGRYKQIRHVRFLGVPGVDHTHTRALVSVVKICGSFCGSGGIFAVEKKDGKWQRSDTTDFTRDCSWMY